MPGRTMAALMAAFVLVGCVPRAELSHTGSASPTSQTRRTVTVAASGPLNGFGPWNGSTVSSPPMDVHSSGLVGRSGAARDALLASKLPSVEEGTMVVLPDGRLRTTWTLRPNVKWHDGAFFTADDVAFGWRVSTDSGIPAPSNSGAAAVLKQIDNVEVPDPLTAVLTWKTPFYMALDVPFRTLWPMPRHLLAEAFEGDKRAFINHPYWTTEYIHLGPFRLEDWGLGENMVFERFDDYFLGRPKVDRVIVRSIPDPATMYANLRAEVIDLTGAMTFEAAIQLRDEWAASDAGVVLVRASGTGFRSLITQFNPEFARPIEVAQDVRVRRGAFVGLDRQAVGEVLYPGVPDTVVVGFLDEADPLAPIVGKPFAQYGYDQARAFREFAGAGWQRTSDGVLRNQTGQQVQLTVRTTPGGDNERENAIVSQLWRQLGMEVTEEVIGPSLVTNLEVRSKFASFEITSVSGGVRTPDRWDSRIAPTPESRYVGNNRGSYTNPDYDRLLDRLRATLQEREQGVVLRQLGEILGRDLPALPLNHAPEATAVRKGLLGVMEDLQAGGSLTGKAYLWEWQS